MGKMMKNVLKKLVRDEEGQAFILVLIFLLVGGLIIAPLLGFMSTGLKVGQMHEEKMEGLYAADAGVEDALYKIINNDALLPAVLGESYPYDLEDETGLIYINGNSVHVEILLEEDIATFLAGLGASDPGTHGDWVVISDLPADGQYTITVTWDPTDPDEPGHENKSISRVGAWFRGHYTCTNDSAGENLVPPLVDITDDYPDYSPIPVEGVPYKGGTAFIWTWTGGDKPWFGKNTGVYTRYQTFEYTLPDTPALYIAWVEVTSKDVGTIPTSVTFGTYTVTATATDTATGEQTVVVAYPSWQGSGGLNAVDILAWEINPQ